MTNEDLPKGGDFVMRDFHLPDVSSTGIRDTLAAGGDISALVPGAVTDYLATHPDLYR